MISDKSLEMSDKQAITTTAVSTNVVAVPPSMGKSDMLFPSVIVGTALAGLTSLEVQLQTSATSGGTFKTIATTGPVLLANANKDLAFSFGTVPPSANKWLRMNYVVVGTGTAGTVTASLVLDRQTNFPE